MGISKGEKSLTSVTKCKLWEIYRNLAAKIDKIPKELVYTGEPQGDEKLAIKCMEITSVSIGLFIFFVDKNMEES